MGEDKDVVARIEANLPLVKHVVFQVAVHFPRHVEREELARAGALGLVEASQRYDESRGVPFERFAAQRIRGAILDSVRAADWAPRSVRNLARKLEQAEQRMANRLGRLPSADELAEELDMERERLDRLQDRVHRSVVLALDHYVAPDDDEELTLVDVLSDPVTLEPDADVELREMRGYLRDAVHLLPERHRAVIVGYFLEGATSLELARYLGVTESRISQLRSEALIMLREGIEAQYDGTVQSPDEVKGRVARRKAKYATAINEASSWKGRVVDLQSHENLDVDVRS
ncbi:MAG: FliA/WhiG family RNA polymerase sigma factor [Actinomycetia bacterium]|nr:FliA/WhiG family RNA polymerase sigma factor [Actinomycetes bacterium]MCP4960832.1 FliA/WhiG family RNA polymerase sigma factor [Actinomycetes bacterium]